jgi:formylmethanofuran dehydrogenase subunit E
MWKFVTQFFKVDEAPEFLRGFGTLTTINHNSTRETRTCSYCHEHFLTEHHGHSCNEIACIGYHSKTSAAKRARIERKEEEAESYGGFEAQLQMQPVN